MPAPNYTLYYWPMPFRGCFVSYQFAYQDVPLNIEGDWQSIREMISEPPEEQSVPFVGPPMLLEHDTGNRISQAPAIVCYVSEKLGLKPDDPFEAAMCHKILMDCNDVLMELCRYNGTLMWDRETWVPFRTERLARWMRVFEQSFERGHLGREKVTFADIACFALWGNMTRCLPELDEDLQRHAPSIHALCKKIGAKPSLAKLVAEQEAKCGKYYCGGQIEDSIREMLKQDTEG